MNPAGLPHRALRILLVFALAVVCAPAADVFSEIERVGRQLAEISGFPLKKKIQYDSITREKVNEYIKKRIKEVTKPEEIRVEELTLKKFGFVPEDFNLEKQTVDLLTEQAAAFYDFHRKKLFVTDWAASGMGRTALVHELAHALADQSYRLERFLRKADDADASMARMAVMEGQATWLTSQYFLETGELPLVSSPDHKPETSNDSPVFDAAPLYIRETLIFPYNEGARFQHAVYEKLGREGLEAVYRNPPASTQQVIHPEKYFTRSQPTTPRLPSPSALRGFKRMARGRLGELDHSILMRQFSGSLTANRLSPRLRGSQYALYERSREKRIALVYVSEWEDADAARDYFAFYQKALRGKWRRMEVLEQTARAVRGLGDDGHFELIHSGNFVTSVEGMR